MDGALMLNTKQASSLGVQQFVDPGNNLAIASTSGVYALWVDCTPPQGSTLWRIHAILAQQFQLTNNQAEQGGLFICAPGTPAPQLNDVLGTAILLPGHVRVDGWKVTNGNATPQVWQKAVQVPIGGKTMQGYCEPSAPERDIIIPPRHFLRWLVVYAGTVPTGNASNWYSLINMLVEQEPSC